MNAAELDAYAAFAPGGIVAQKVPELSIHGGMPVVRMSRDLDGTPEAAAGESPGSSSPQQLGDARQEKPLTACGT